MKLCYRPSAWANEAEPDGTYREGWVSSERDRDVAGLIGLLSCGVAMHRDPRQAGLAAFVSMVIGPLKWMHEAYTGRKAREMRAAET